MTEAKEKYDIRIRGLQDAFNSARFIAARIKVADGEAVSVAVFDRIIAKKELESALLNSNKQISRASFTVENCLKRDFKCMNRVWSAKSFGVRFSSGDLDSILESLLSVMEWLGIGLSLVRDVKGDQLVIISRKNKSEV